MDILVLENCIIYKKEQPKAQKKNEIWKQEFELDWFMNKKINQKVLREFGILLGIAFPFLIGWIIPNI